MVDGLFVSNLIGTSALSAINLTAPVIQLVTAVSTMLATGGSAVIMKKMGEHKTEEAKEDFTFLILVNVVVGFLMCGLGYLMMDRIFAGMNLSADVEGYCVEYLSRYLLFTVPILLMNNFTLYMIASEKAALSLVCSVTGGVLNMVLDFVFIAGFGMGISGAAVATGLGYSVTAVAGLIVFSRKKSLLHFKKPVMRFKVLAGAATNGCSEMATALVTGIITMMFNWTMLRYVGEDGVAAVTIIMYVLMFASSLYTGYSYGVAPMLSYYYGEQNHEKLKKLVAVSLKVIAVISVMTVVMSFALTKPLVSVFARPDNPVYGLAVTGNRICTIALFFIGFNIFASGMFTALSNGVVSAILAFSRSFVFMLATMLVLPLILGVNGIWLATPAAELMALLLSAGMFLKYRKRYGY
jgi:putative MATE family efflux protein